MVLVFHKITLNNQNRWLFIKNEPEIRRSHSLFAFKERAVNSQLPPLQGEGVEGKTFSFDDRQWEWYWLAAWLVGFFANKNRLTFPHEDSAREERECPQQEKRRNVVCERTKKNEKKIRGESKHFFLPLLKKSAKSPRKVVHYFEINEIEKKRYDCSFDPFVSFSGPHCFYLSTNTATVLICVVTEKTSDKKKWTLVYCLIVVPSQSNSEFARFFFVRVFTTEKSMCVRNVLHIGANFSSPRIFFFFF